MLNITYLNINIYNKYQIHLSFNYLLANKTIGLIILIQELAGPSGQHCWCFGVVNFSAWSVFFCSIRIGEFDIQGPSGIVARWHI